MKKLVVLFLTAIMILQATACGKAEVEEKEENNIKDNVKTEEQAEEQIEEEPEVEEKLVEDTLGLEYEEHIFDNLGCSVSLPAEWEITSQDTMVQVMHASFDKEFSNVEITIMYLGEFTGDTSLLRLRNESLDTFRLNLKYHGFNDTYEVMQYDMLSGAEEVNGFLHQPFGLSFLSTKYNHFSIRPSSSVYYTFIENKGYMISVVGPSGKDDVTNEIAAIVKQSFK